MADFVETIKKWDRMCNSTSCSSCALSYKNNGTDMECTDYIGKHPHEALAAIEKWAEEHPEPVYPSWETAWSSLFPNSFESLAPCPKHFMTQERVMEYCDNRCDKCSSRPIPADIAEKLHIRPTGDESYG